MSVYELWEPFIDLFGGLDHIKSIGAFGTGAGRWIKRPLKADDVVQHLQGQGNGIGIPPLAPDNTVRFAAIDLDEPDFEAAETMSKSLPGTSWVERSRSGNAHVWVFFNNPLEAWIPMGILREATKAAGKEHVEVFPKNWDFSRVTYGNYINLPFHGDTRPILWGAEPYPLERFVNDAGQMANDPAEWRKRSAWLLISPPDEDRERSDFGKQPNLHICGEHILENCEESPVVEGHRAAVYFALSKMLLNWELCDYDEALTYLNIVNDASPDPVSGAELRRILGNAERGEYTSTGCDDPLVVGYAHPDCLIANRS